MASKVEKVMRLDVNGTLVEVLVAADRSYIAIGIQNTKQEDKSEEFETVYAEFDFESAKAFQMMVRNSIRNLKKPTEATEVEEGNG